MLSRRDARCAVAAVFLVLLSGAAGAVRADDGIAFAESLVRRVWFEGLPYAQARQLSPQGVERLAQMLEDPAEAEHHVNIVVALGMSESPRAFPALERFAAREPQGEVDRTEYRARNALPFALGHLARADRRALGWLRRELERGTPPAWSFRHLAGERLRAQLERGSVTALGMSGLPEADGVLDTVSQRATRRRDARLAEHVARARALRARVAREGAARVFGGRP
jgi:hypothetical protein